MGMLRGSGAVARRSAATVCVVVLAAVGCGAESASRPYEAADEVFEAAGGASWCGSELRLTMAPFVGNCGPDDGRIVIGAGFEERQELAESVRRAIGRPLMVLVPGDLGDDGAWFQLRSQRRDALEEAQVALGGEILDGDEQLEDWLDRNG